MNNQLIKFLNITGLTWFVPLVKIAAGENPAQQIRELFLIMGVPIIAFILFLGLWSVSASKVNTIWAQFRVRPPFGRKRAIYWMSISPKKRKKLNIINAKKSAMNKN